MGAPLTPMGSFSILTLEGDNDTWSLTLFGPSKDTPLKAMRDPDVSDRVVAACPRQAHWLDGRPITDVLAMAGVLDSYRRLIVDGRPVVTGVVVVGDQPATLAWVYDEWTEAVVTRFYWSQIKADRIRAAEMDALRRGVPPAPPDPLMTRFQSAAMYDADVYRGLLEIVTCLALPREVLNRPAVQEGMQRYGDEPPLPSPGPDRAGLLDLLTA